MRKVNLMASMLLVLNVLPTYLFANTGLSDEMDDHFLYGGLVIVFAAAIGHIASKSRSSRLKRQ